MQIGSIHGAHSVTNFVPTVNPVELQAWAARLEKVINDMSAVVIDHDRRMEAVEAKLTVVNDFLTFTRGVYPNLIEEFNMNREALKRLTL